MRSRAARCCPVLPSREEFPYAIRQLSEAMGSNGSTSMGSVCASTLSLLQAGVPLQGLRRRHRDGPDLRRGRRQDRVRRADRHPRRRGRLRRHGLQGRRHPGVRHRAAARHQARRHPRRGARRRADPGPRRPPGDPRRDGRGHRRARGDVGARAADHHACGCPSTRSARSSGPRARSSTRSRTTRARPCRSRTTARSTSVRPTARRPRLRAPRSTRSPTRRCPRSASATSAPSSRRPTSVRSSRCCPARTACCTSASCVAWPVASGSTTSRTSSRSARRSRSRSPRSTTAASCRWSRSWTRTPRRSGVRRRLTTPRRLRVTAEVLKGLPDGVRRTVLKGGLRVVTEHMPGVRSAAVGVFVQVGSRDEAAQLNGASHFLEHLLFKGTPTRSAMDISAALDEVGGEFNAYTAREYTCYHARVLDEDLPMAVDVLGDMLTSSLLTSEDVEAEREVILDEIAMHDDDPDDVVHNLFAATAWAGTPLARPIAGTAESIKALTARPGRGYYKRRYRPEVDDARRGRQRRPRRRRTPGAARPSRATTSSPATPSRAGPRARRAAAAAAAGEVSATRPFEQVNVVLGHAGADPLRPAPLRARHAADAALGGGSSSRLFQEVRERRGLAYSVYSFGLGYSDAGMVGVAAGSLPSKADELLRVVREELAQGRRVRPHRGGGRARQGPGARRPGAQPRGQRLPDDPPRRGRAVPAPAALGRRGARAPRLRSPWTTCTPWPRSCSRGRRRSPRSARPDLGSAAADRSWPRSPRARPHSVPGCPPGRLERRARPRASRVHPGRARLGRSGGSLFLEAGHLVRWPRLLRTARSVPADSLDPVPLVLLGPVRLGLVAHHGARVHARAVAAAAASALGVRPSTGAVWRPPSSTLASSAEGGRDVSASHHRRRRRRRRAARRARWRRGRTVVLELFVGSWSG